MKNIIVMNSSNIVTIEQTSGDNYVILQYNDINVTSAKCEIYKDEVYYMTLPVYIASGIGYVQLPNIFDGSLVHARLMTSTPQPFIHILVDANGDIALAKITNVIASNILNGDMPISIDSWDILDPANPPSGWKYDATTGTFQYAPPKTQLLTPKGGLNTLYIEDFKTENYDAIGSSFYTKADEWGVKCIKFDVQTTSWALLNIGTHIGCKFTSYHSTGRLLNVSGKEKLHLSAAYYQGDDGPDVVKNTTITLALLDSNGEVIKSEVLDVQRSDISDTAVWSEIDVDISGLTSVKLQFTVDIEKKEKSYGTAKLCIKEMYIQ